MPISEQNFDRELLGSKMAVASHNSNMSENTDRGLLNSIMSATSRIPDAEQYVDKELLSSTVAATSHVPENTERQLLNSSKVAATSPMPENTELNSATSHMPNSERNDNIEIGSVLEGTITAKKKSGYRLKLAPGVTTLLRKFEIRDIEHVCCILCSIPCILAVHVRMCEPA
jgi:hypothetical protein